ncbi:MAG: N-acetylglucosamine kinase [Acidimicrobiales bacterium]
MDLRRPALLALDGGGSKVDAALLSVDGQVLGAARWETGVAQGPAGWGDGEEIGLGPAVEAACVDAGLDPGVRPIADLGMYCLAGADLPADYERIERSLAGQGWSAETVLRNDTFAVLRSGSERSWGVAVVCGTGTNCAAIAPDGRTFRLPAVGHISGDWGGGHDIGMAALWHAVRAEDGRGEPTVLDTLVPEHFGLVGPSQLMEAFYFGRIEEARLVELPPIVFAAARRGDRVASSIIERQADEVVTMVVTALQRLGLADQHGLDVVVGGGIFRNEHGGFFDRIEQGISRVAKDFRIRVVTDPPVVGAALLGLDQLAATPQAAARAHAALTHGRLERDDAGKGNDAAGDSRG